MMLLPKRRNNKKKMLFDRTKNRKKTLSEEVRKYGSNATKVEKTQKH